MLRIRQFFFWMAVCLCAPLTAQVRDAYIDSAHVARFLAEDAGIVVEPAEDDTVVMAEACPAVADGAGFDALWAERFGQRMGDILQDPLLRSTQMAVMVWDLSSDRAVFCHDEQQRMRPASVQKCVTAIAALHRLGADYEFSTKIYATGDIDSTGTLHGSLCCVGGMDPLFADADMRGFVDAVRKAGIRTVAGGLLADKNMKDDKPMGEGWCWDDDSSNPCLSPLTYGRRDRFLGELAGRLRAAGVSVQGGYDDGALPPGATLIGEERHSLQQVLRRMMKQSDNLHAESVFYQLAKASGQRRAGARLARQEVNAVVREVGLAPSDYYVADGSGLSLYNYVSAEMVVRLLRLNYQDSTAHEALLRTLPIAGRDGTLRSRLRGTAADGNVRAKTGTVARISTLAGFCTASNGHRLAFAILNQGSPKGRAARDLQDRVCRAMCE